MDVTSTFRVEQKDDKIVINQLIVKTMDLKESMQEFKKMEQEIVQVQKQKDEMQKALDDRKFETDLDLVKENETKILALKEDWTKINKPQVDAILKDIKKQIRVKKLEKGFDRVKDRDGKMTMVNQILGPIMNEADIEMDSRIVQELKKEFGDI